MQNLSIRIALALVALALLLSPPAGRAEIAPVLAKQLDDSKYVYIASTRKDGTLGKPAEIWFLYSKGAVYVASPQTTWRVRRIKAGRPQAQIAVGKVDGDSFMATGQVVNDPEAPQMVMKTFAEKYPDGWPKHADSFRAGFKDGTTVVIKYTPD